MSLLESWRWYGPNDDVLLSDIEQTGAEGIVHALHHIKVGEIWEVDEIKKRQYLIEFNKELNKPRNLKWVVVESLNVHESIKQGLPQRDQLINNFNESLKNLAECGIKTICYNFMPVLDWTRTDLQYVYKDGSKALRYDAIALAAFDLYILKRKNAIQDYSDSVIKKASDYFEELSSFDKKTLTNNILQGVPGSGDTLTIDQFSTFLEAYEGISKEQLQDNLNYFLHKVIPTAEKYGMLLCCHPDDPPISIFGLPRIVSNQSDLEFLISCVDSPSNGITFCTGSLGPDATNIFSEIISKIGHRIHFIHLRNIQREEDGSFHEADHLDGSVDMYKVVNLLVKESERRIKEGRPDFVIPFRPDHGHQMLDDLDKKVKFHGYSAIGRLRGLAELRGLILGITSK